MGRKIQDFSFFFFVIFGDIFWVLIVFEWYRFRFGCDYGNTYSCKGQAKV